MLFRVCSLNFQSWIWFRLANFKVQNLILQKLVSVGRHLIYTTTSVYLRAIKGYVHETPQKEIFLCKLAIGSLLIRWVTDTTHSSQTDFGWNLIALVVSRRSLYFLSIDPFCYGVFTFDFWCKMALQAKKIKNH